jgi:hypothetical protein
MKQIISKEEVSKAILDLAGQGKKPTLAAVHAALNNRGSMSTLVRLKAEIEAAALPTTDSSEALKALREIWALAVDEGRKQQEVILGELRESLKTLAMENERLEGTSVAAQNHAFELELAKSRAETELSQATIHVEAELKEANNAFAEATIQAAGALQKLAEAQAANAAQVSALQTDLTAAVCKLTNMNYSLCVPQRSLRRTEYNRKRQHRARPSMPKKQETNRECSSQHILSRPFQFLLGTTGDPQSQPRGAVTVRASLPPSEMGRSPVSPRSCRSLGDTTTEGLSAFGLCCHNFVMAGLAWAW